MATISLLLYSINLICVSISIIFCLNKKIIFINKFRKHNWINISVYEIKYLDVFLSISFFIFIYGLWFFYLLTHIILDLFDYMYAQIFLFSLKLFLTIKTCWKKYLTRDKALIQETRFFLF